MPAICESNDPNTRSSGLGWTENQDYYLGYYETGLRYLGQSLLTRQEIGDVAGLCATLFNMGHIHWQNGEQREAVVAWGTVYQLARQLDLAQVLQALTRMAEQLGLDGGLDGWAALSEQMAVGQ